MGLVGELPEQGVTPVDQGDLAGHRQPPGLVQRQHQLGQGPGGLDPGRPAAHDHYIDRAGVAGRRIIHRGLQEALQMEPQTFSVGHGIQRKGVLCGAGHSEEIRLCTRRHHQMRALQHAPVGERETACGQVRRGHLRSDHLDRRVFPEDGPVGAGDVLGGQLRAGHLV
jgi:hypothetical protein